MHLYFFSSLRYFGMSSKMGQKQLPPEQQKNAKYSEEDFWRSQRNGLPTLYKMALKHLSIPASSIYSERLFSEFGNLYEKKRSRLLPKNSSKMLFLHHNYPILDKEKRLEELKKLSQQTRHQTATRVQSKALCTSNCDETILHYNYYTYCELYSIYTILTILYNTTIY